MIVDIFKDGLFNKLKEHDQYILDAYKTVSLEGKDTWWFNPNKQNKLPPFTNNPNYCLTLYPANYLPIFLANLLLNNKSIIEDFGCGDGKFIYYLIQLGFTKFSVWDNWQECPQYIFYKIIHGSKGINNYWLNDSTVQPNMINNSMCPSYFPTIGFRDNLRDFSNTKIITFYQNKDWERNYVPIYLEPRGYVFLCRDAEDKSQAYCKKELFDEYINKLKPYRISDEKEKSI